MSLTENLIELIENKNIEERDLEKAKWFLLDSIANIVAGRNTKPGKILNRWFLEEPPDTSRKVFFLGALMHILEVDDLHRQSVVHPGCVVIPTVLSLGLREGISGIKMIEAVLKGFEACTRIGNSVGSKHYKIWHNTATCGTFGAAYAAGSILELSKSQLLDALGNAGTQSSGLWEFVEFGNMSKHLHAGRAGQSGFLAAELAKFGLSGANTILEGKRGFYAAFCPDAIPEVLLKDQNGPWQLHKTSIKPWPCCRHTHPSIDAALELSDHLNQENLKNIELEVTQSAINVCYNPTPRTLYDAKFSLQHCVSVALLDGIVDFDSFDSEKCKRTSTMSSLINVKINKEFEDAYPESWGAEVKITLQSGKELSARRLSAKGDPDSPLTILEMKKKAETLFNYGGVKKPDYWVEKVLGIPTETSFSNSTIKNLFDFTGKNQKDIYNLEQY